MGAWWVCTIVGLAVGGTIPDEVDIGFTIPAMFIALLAPSLTTRPAAATAVVAGAVAVLSAPLPSGLNIVVGAVSGLAAGRLAMAAGGQE